MGSNWIHEHTDALKLTRYRNKTNSSVTFALTVTRRHDLCSVVFGAVMARPGMTVCE